MIPYYGSALRDSEFSPAPMFAPTAPVFEYKAPVQVAVRRLLRSRSLVIRFYERPLFQEAIAVTHGKIGNNDDFFVFQRRNIDVQEKLF